MNPSLPLGSALPTNQFLHSDQSHMKSGYANQLNEGARRKITNTSLLNDIKDACKAFDFADTVPEEDNLHPVAKCKALCKQLSNDVHAVLDCVKEVASSYPSASGKKPVGSQEVKTVEELHANVNAALQKFYTTCDNMAHQLRLVDVLSRELVATRQHSQRTNVNLDSINWDGPMRNSILGQTRRYTESVEALRQILGGIGKPSSPRQCEFQMPDNLDPASQPLTNPNAFTPGPNPDSACRLSQLPFQ